MRTVAVRPVMSTMPAASAIHRRWGLRWPCTPAARNRFRSAAENSGRGWSSGALSNAARSVSRTLRRPLISIRHDEQVSRCQRMS
jgi:hypothetical protein